MKNLYQNPDWNSNFIRSWGAKYSVDFVSACLQSVGILGIDLSVLVGVMKGDEIFS